MPRLPREVGATGSHWLADVPEVGYKFHMNDVAAAIGIGQMGDLESSIEHHRRNAAYYQVNLADFGGVIERPHARSSFWLYTIHVENRDAFIETMRRDGIEVSQVHARNDRYSAFAACRIPLPGVDSFCETMVCVPVGWWIDDEQRRYITSCILKNGIPTRRRL